MTAFDVRPAREDEYGQAGELCVRAYVAGGHLDPTDHYANTLRNAAARAASSDVLVAVRDESIVGTVTICPAGSEWSELALDGESEFRFLAVDPSAWRTGVGEALVGAAETRARKRGQTSHVICVIDRNDGAHAFYRRLGFARLPERDWEPVPGVVLLAYRRAVPYSG
jgi:ribosomal protein S18 acetylase RimI-like enzyme